MKLPLSPKSAPQRKPTGWSGPQQELTLKINLTVHGLERFVTAQNQVCDSVRAELALGEKTTHWMWFIFPQLKALGRSATAKHFGIESLEEATYNAL